MNFPPNLFSGMNGGYDHYQMLGLTAGRPMDLPLGLPSGLPMGPPPSFHLMEALATTRLNYDEW
ncbi:hypothetical protein RvY_04989 [Ramazzottius varieornatus]|uniref:Uncharacterized protein n=1 Tax=Ramazzottius varieornatus TaxID=947166 RepID=A0A1D1UTH5_RAMVA|nr:hypothetical protein RvY_04989 [Ramazzottius varieornatus]